MELEEGLYDLCGNEIRVGMNIGFLVAEVKLDSFYDPLFWEAWAMQWNINKFLWKW